jgi:predicted dehydrogenase
MTRKARIGVIGAGWWAAANHLPVLKANNDCEIVAINSLGAAKLAEVQRKFEAPQAFEDYCAMLDQVPMDGVVISSPHVLALRARCRSSGSGSKPQEARFLGRSGVF